MLGAIIGDIVGSRFEFNPTNEYHFELFTPECSFTDDTVCTIAVADAILHSSRFALQSSQPYGEYIHRWCRRYPHPMGGYGGSFALWVANDHPQPYNSFGNGSAMRVSPVAWLADSYAEAVLSAKYSAECTHNHLSTFRARVCERLEQKKHAALEASMVNAEQNQAIMHWKLGWWHQTSRENAIDTNPPATADDWQTEPMPTDNITAMDIHLTLTAADMERLRKGHIPECQEDHWFMYVDDSQIHIHRSWTG